MVKKSKTSQLWFVLTVIGLALLMASGTLFFLSGRKDEVTRKPILIDCGAINNYKHGTVTLIGKGNFYIACLEDGGFLAISKRCTHLGCSVPWIKETKQFECPCHASVFSITGDILKSPAAKALDLFKITFSGDKLNVDISKPIHRSKFIANQVTHPLKVNSLVKGKINE